MRSRDIANLKSTLFAITGFLVLSCVEEVDTIPAISLTSSSDNILIVEAIITDELSNQEIKLSTSSDLGEEIINPESNAVVVVTDDLGNSHNFLESSPGIYLSQEEFSAQQDLEYQISIQTESGEIFISDSVVLSGISEIQDLHAQRVISNNGVDGVGIFANSSSLSSNNTIRYTYVETYKIIAPSWSPFEFVILNDNEFEVAVRQQEERICFKTVASNDIILTNNLDLEEGQEKQLIRFIGKDNFIISHRYGILVKQFVHTRSGYDFYRILDSFSSNDNLFTAVQPGLIEGNIESNNSSRKVIGLFDVVSVSERRLFFDYEDLFPTEPLPDYPFNCRIFSPTTTDDIFAGIVEYVGENDSPSENELPIFVTLKACGDCTALGTNTVPDFWEE